MSDRHIHDRRDCEVCEKLHATIDALEARAEAAERDAEALRAVLLKNASQGLATDGLCWCFYVRCVHPADDPHDAVPIRDGHTEDCWACRAAVGPGPDGWQVMTPALARAALAGKGGK